MLSLSYEVELKVDLRLLMRLRIPNSKIEFINSFKTYDWNKRLGFGQKEHVREDSNDFLNGYINVEASQQLVKILYTTVFTFRASMEQFIDWSEC